MALSERLGETLRSPGQRTVLYVVAFGLGSLAISGFFSWLAVSVAESMLPSATSAAAPKDAASPSASVRLPLGLSSASKPSSGPRTLSASPGSNAASGRGNDSPPNAGE